MDTRLVLKPFIGNCNRANFTLQFLLLCTCSANKLQQANQIRQYHVYNLDRLARNDICIPYLFAELLATFFDFGIFTSSASLTLKLTVASLCNMLRHLDVVITGVRTTGPRRTQVKKVNKSIHFSTQSIESQSLTQPSLRNLWSFLSIFKKTKCFYSLRQLLS